MSVDQQQQQQQQCDRETELVHQLPANQQIYEVNNDDDDSSTRSDDEGENAKNQLSDRIQHSVNNQVTDSKKVSINNSHNSKTKNYYKARVVYVNQVISSSPVDNAIDPDKVEKIPLEAVTVEKDSEANIEPESSNDTSQPLCTQERDPVPSWCTKRRLLIICGALAGIAIIGFIIYAFTPGDLLYAKNSATTVSSNAVVANIHTEVSLVESTTATSDDYSHSTKCTMNQNELITEIAGLNIEKNSTAGVEYPLKIISRAEWRAQPPQHPLTKLAITPVPRVIITETLTKSCEETKKCMRIVRAIQWSQSPTGFSQYSDIAYNFLVGGDGLVYEGRGWNMKGNVAAVFDDESVSIAFIGSFSSITPPENQVRAALRLIQYGIENGKIVKSFKLYGEKQLKYLNNNIPGDRLYDIITKWKQWQPGTIGKDLDISLDEEFL